jgi:prepilin-type N-terminal cleavage/methylation domain-containing protein/prepilin-type processing-associated H-X9-DG protein
MKMKTDARGFTLVELLVVIAVIVMLVALVAPALALSKDRGQGARCLGNLRQLTAAWLAYTTDNRGKLVPNGEEANQPVSPSDPSGLPGGANVQWCPGRQDLTMDLSPANSPTNVGYAWIKLGLMYSYVGNVSAYLCPADTSAASAFGLSYPHVRSVSMNTWLGPISPFNDVTTVESYYKDSDLVRPGPSQLLVFLDESPLSINDGSFICEPGIEQWIDGPATYHNGGGGLSFADGHAEIKRWTDQAVLTEWASPTIAPGNPGYVRLTPEQNPPRDLSFLQSASTYVR